MERWAYKKGVELGGHRTLRT
ncbi:hypothetical protein XFF6990_200264 [Xanthomonas citri pv. fuscans]|uniref:Uncharacterized protein n=1 Tax=Xanthomonas campestris pv. phaseoli TaxID=317013 RepID=A0A7Z7J1B8_XANCH|nr:hypothetical protein XFF6990_200264 [Xanthomonas citri pv. fuscans]SOO25508.1 hypothetical protein XFF6991_460063 [Xanthomonas phaseoli pv. phaseoli]